jgi:phenylacetate-coenzyme A ligase PaaK-like adenylate-forming protein
MSNTNQHYTNTYYKDNKDNNDNDKNNSNNNSKYSNAQSEHCQSKNLNKNKNQNQNQIQKTCVNHLDYLLDISLPGSGDLPPRLLKHRLTKLSETLSLAAKNTLFYKTHNDSHLRAVGLLGNLASQNLTLAEGNAEIQKIMLELPITRPEYISQNPEAFLAVPQDEVDGLISVPSSGSLGPYKRIFSTRDDLENIITFFQYGMLNLIGHGARVGLMMSGLRPGSVGELLVRALDRWNIPCEVLGFLPANSEEHSSYLSKIENTKPTCLVGLPSQLIFLAKTSKMPKTLETILLSGEPVPEGLSNALAKHWPVEIFIHYGLTEFGLGGAVECAAHTGPHLREADLLIEILDTDGSPLPCGERGEICLTSLSRRAMPILRYCPGDLGTLLDTPCGCGSILRRLKVYGRSQDEITLSGGKKVHLSDITSKLYSLDEIASFTVSYNYDEKDALTVTIGNKDPFGSGAGDPSDLEIRALRLLKENLGPEAWIKVIQSSDPLSPAPQGAKPTLKRGF